MTMPPPKPERSNSNASHADSVTAMDYIKSQLELESDAREALPYAFDTCTRPLGVLRQPVYSCRTCSPLNPSAPPAFGASKPDGAAALCYSCSISCHGDHELVEIFEKRNVSCDCGTKRIPGVRCKLTKVVDVDGEQEGAGREYGQNYWGRFCWCQVEYKPDLESGTMYQCLLGDACGEDWFHDVCIVGLGPPKYHGAAPEGGEGEKEEEQQKKKEENKDATSPITEGPSTEPAATATGEPIIEKDRIEVDVIPTANNEEKSAPIEIAEGEADDGNQDDDDDDDDDDPPPPGFPTENFEHFICWRCVEKNPWLKRYSGTPGFLPAVPRKTSQPTATDTDEQPPLSSSTSTIPDPPASSAATIPDPPSQPFASSKRKASEELSDAAPAAAKRAKNPDAATALVVPMPCTAPPALPLSAEPVSLFTIASFRPHLCRCAQCYPLLAPFKCLREEEETYSPPLDADSNAQSEGGSSLYDAGERALSAVDRVRALEGVMAYNHLKDKVKAFLKPFAESGETVGAEAVKEYFAKLRGDNMGESEKKGTENGEKKLDGGGRRKEGEGY